MAIELAWTVPDAPWMSSVEIWGVFDSQPRDASLMGEFRLPSKPLYPIRPEPWYENLVLGANTRCGWTVGTMVSRWAGRAG